MRSIRKFLHGEYGATALEYGLIAALIALAVVVVLPGLGYDLRDKYQDIANAFAH